MLNYSLKNIKTFIGMEGQGFNLTLYRDGKKVAFVIDDACGGDFQYQWVDPKEEGILKAYCATLPKTKFADGELETCRDIFIDELINTQQLLKKLTTMLKKKTVFVQNEKCYTNATPFSPAIAQRLKTTYAGAIILNELPIEKASELFNKYAVR